jgi:MFS family permease
MVERSLPQDKAGTLASAVMVLAIVGAPVGGFLTDRWRKTKPRARLLFPAVSTVLTAVFLFAALYLFRGTIQFVLFLIMGVLIMAFISGAASVTQDVIHPGLRAMSYAVAVVVQNLLGSSTAPIVVGKIYDETNIKTALSFLPFVLLAGALLFYLGSRKYDADMKKVAKIELKPAS